MQPKIKYGFIATAITLSLITFDQLSKWWASQILLADTPATSFLNWLWRAPPLRTRFAYEEALPFLNWVMVWNEGISFGLLSGPNTALTLSLLALIVTAGFIYWLAHATHILQFTGSILVIAGALGNVMDRLRFGAVIDFIDLHAFGYHWPAFNLADSFICIGIALLLLHTLYCEHTKP